ncbi:MAG: K(+)-transporting ATPase subunit F [Austwickia sp.]|nr:MAG: K(+)-transporting ATPase subunit F [Austwickia sp.]
MLEQWIAAFVAMTLVAYLVYALVNPEKF